MIFATQRSRSGWRWAANLLRVSSWLGHSTVQITADIYGHLFRETNDLVVGRLDRALRKALARADKAAITGDAST